MVWRGFPIRPSRKVSQPCPVLGCPCCSGSQGHALFCPAWASGSDPCLAALVGAQRRPHPHQELRSSALSLRGASVCKAGSERAQHSAPELIWRSVYGECHDQDGNGWGWLWSLGDRLFWAEWYLGLHWHLQGCCTGNGKVILGLFQCGYDQSLFKTMVLWLRHWTVAQKTVAKIPFSLVGTLDKLEYISSFFCLTHLQNFHSTN